MTYLGSHSQSDLIHEDRVIPHEATSAPGFGKTEWDVVELARRDGPRSLNPHSTVAHLCSILLGEGIKRPLANEQLEALRRFSVRAWFWDLVRTKDVRTLFDAGFTWDDAWRVLAHVAARRGFMPSVEISDVTVSA